MSHISVKILAISFFAALFVTDETLDPPTMTAFFPFCPGVWPPQERQRPAGRQRHLPWNSWLPGICPQQPAIHQPVLQVSPRVHQGGGWFGEVCLLRVVFHKKKQTTTLVLVNLRRLLCWIHGADLKSLKSVFLMPHLVCKLEIKKCHMKGKTNHLSRVLKCF